MAKSKSRTGYGFGTFQGVFTPSILTIIGVVMYLRFGWMLGNVGLAASLAIVTIGSTITFLTGLSISALATNMRMKGGGAYFMLSRSFGAEAGAAMGMPLALSQAIGVSFYVAGFAEALVNSGLPAVAGWDPRFVGFATLATLAVVSTLSANIALKSQYLVMGAIAFSLVSFLSGHPPAAAASGAPAAAETPVVGFWPVFAVFFPAVTGILSGVGMSGDLKNPGRAIPLGTIAAVLTGYAVYMAIPIALSRFVQDDAWLRADTMILAKCARWPLAILVGVWAATLSSAVGSFLCAPRVLQALSRDRMMPRVFGRGWGETDDPRFSSFCCFAIAAAGLWLGDINAIAPILTMFNLSTYALLNLSAGLESAMGNPSWRPTFRVKPVFSLLGFALCVGAMFMISPGWTFAAIACELAIWWFAKRRVMRARWGDMRTGLYVAAARFAMLRLEGMAPDLRNWRPDVLAFTELPVHSVDVVDLAKAISGGRGMVTLASVVPTAAGGQSRERELAGILRAAARKRGLAALARVHASDDTWRGMRDLVGCYGFGPFVPDTILLGMPSKEREVGSISELTAFLADRQRSVLLVRDRVDPAEEVLDRHSGDLPRIDVWWRGQNENGSFMLAIAHLMVQSNERRLGVRLCQIAEEGDDTADVKKVLAKFVAESRVEAETFVRPYDRARAPVETIARASADAEFAFIGLRAPFPGESASAYGDYIVSMRDATAAVPCVVFALAADGVMFKRIFKE